MKSCLNIIKKSIIVPLCTVMLFSCENDIKKINIITAKEEIADYSADTVRMTYSDSANIVLSVFSPSIKKYTYAERPYTDFPQGIVVVQYGVYPDTSAMIRANYAVKWDEEKFWEAKGNVVAKNTKGETLNTEYLIWNEAEKQISSDQQVVITTEEDIIIGEGFTADQDFTNWKLEKVKGFININN